MYVLPPLPTLKLTSTTKTRPTSMPMRTKSPNTKQQPTAPTANSLPSSSTSMVAFPAPLSTLLTRPSAKNASFPPAYRNSSSTMIN